MNNVGVIDTFLNTFTTYIDSGFGLIKGEVGYLSSTLIVIDITLAGLFWAWGADEDILQRLVKKTLYIGFFAFIITNFNNLSAIVFNSFAGLGLKAGGSSISTADFLRPGKLAQVGLDAGQPLLDAANQMMGFTSFFANFVQIAVLMVSWVLVLIAFFILAVQLFVTLIEFKLTTLAGFILIPFALFNKTAFLAEKVLGNIVASGIKVMVLAVIVGIGTGPLLAVHADLRRRPADGRASAVRRAGRARHAGPRHLRPRHRHRPGLRRAAARRGRRRRDWPGRRGYGDGRRRRARPGRQGGDGRGFRHCRRRARRGGNGRRRVLRLQPCFSRPVRRVGRRGRTRRGRASGRFSRRGSCAARRRSSRQFDAGKLRRRRPVQFRRNGRLVDRRDGRRRFAEHARGARGRIGAAPAHPPGPSA